MSSIQKSSRVYFICNSVHALLITLEKIRRDMHKIYFCKDFTIMVPRPSFGDILDSGEVGISVQVRKIKRQY